MATEFEVFRRKLADAVTIAINSGVMVSSDDHGGCCPLGCMPGAYSRRPAAMTNQLWAFAEAFDHGLGHPEYPEYAALGVAYQKRFP